MSPSLSRLSVLSLFRVIDIANGLHILGPEATGLSENAWTNILDHPDVTAQVAVPGFDIFGKYPSSPADWAFSVTVGQDIDLDKTNRTSDINQTTAAVVQFGPPGDDAIDNTAHESWQVCQAWYFFRLAASAEVAGDCKGALPQRCRDDLLENLVVGSKQTGGSQCRVCGIPDSCYSVLEAAETNDDLDVLNGVSGSSCTSTIPCQSLSAMC